MKFLTYYTWSRNRHGKIVALVAIAIAAAVGILFAFPWTEQSVGFAEIAPKVQWSLLQPEPGSFQTSLKHGDRIEVQKLYFRETSNPDHLDFELVDRVLEGNRVKAGDRIAVLSSWMTNSELQALRDEHAVVEANLALLKAGCRPEDIVVVRKEFEIAQQNFEAFTTEYERTKALHDSGYVSNAEFESAENQHMLLEKQLGLARSKLNASVAGESPERIKVEERTLEKLKQQIALLEDGIARDEIVTPISGVIIRPDSPAVFCKIAQLDEMTVKILIREQDLLYVHPGGKFVVRPFAVPEARFESEVEYIQFSPIKLNNRSYFVAIGHVTNNDGTLMPGMLGTARIYGRKTTIYRYIYNRIKHTIFVQFGI